MKSGSELALLGFLAGIFFTCLIMLARFYVVECCNHLLKLGWYPGQQKRPWRTIFGFVISGLMLTDYLLNHF